MSLFSRRKEASQEAEGATAEQEWPRRQEAILEAIEELLTYSYQHGIGLHPRNGAYIDPDGRLYVRGNTVHISRRGIPVVVFPEAHTLVDARLEAPPVTPEAVAAYVRRNSAVLHCLHDCATEQKLLMNRDKVKARMEKVVREHELLHREIARYSEVRKSSRRMELLTEAFQRGLDTAPIFTAIAAAKSVEELAVLAEELAEYLTPAEPLEAAFAAFVE